MSLLRRVQRAFNLIILRPSVLILFFLGINLGICLPLYAKEKNALIFGGACEDPSDVNQFEKSFTELDNGYQKKKWKTQILFDKSATRASLLEYLDSRSKKLKKGDQLIINLMTHGSGEYFQGSSLKAHGLCLGDGSTLPVDDPGFLAALRKLKQNGVQLAFLDSSCYGGGAVRVLKEFGCVLASQTSEAEAHGSGVNSILADFLNNGKSGNLDQVFKQTLFEGVSSGNFPQSSDYESQMASTNRFVKGLIHPKDGFIGLPKLSNENLWAYCQDSKDSSFAELKKFIANNQDIFEKYTDKQWEIELKEYTDAYPDFTGELKNIKSAKHVELMTKDLLKEAQKAQIDFKKYAELEKKSKIKMNSQDFSHQYFISSIPNFGEYADFDLESKKALDNEFNEVIKELAAQNQLELVGDVQNPLILPVNGFPDKTTYGVHYNQAMNFLAKDIMAKLRGDQPTPEYVEKLSKFLIQSNADAFSKISQKKKVDFEKSLQDYRQSRDALFVLTNETQFEKSVKLKKLYAMARFIQAKKQDEQGRSGLECKKFEF